MKRFAFALIAAASVTAHASDNQAFDAYPNTPFEQIAINDGTDTLLVVKGHDGLLHHVVSMQDDAHCNGHTASILGNTSIKFNSVEYPVTQACSTAGTLYLSLDSAKADADVSRVIASSDRLTVSGPAVGLAVFDVSLYSSTLRQFGLIN